MVSIEVWSDFACPWCYLGASAIKKLQASHAVDVVWRAYEIRPKGTPLSPDYKQRILAARKHIEQAAQENFDGLTFGGGPFGVNSRPAHVGMKYAQAHTVGDAFHAAVMDLYWQQNRDIEDVEVLVQAASDAGLDQSSFRDALNQDAYLRAVSADVEQAFQYGIGGVPSLIFAQRHLLQGAHPYPTLVKIIEQLETKATI